jgi:hypothetical protein
MSSSKEFCAALRSALGGGSGGVVEVLDKAAASALPFFPPLYRARRTLGACVEREALRQRATRCRFATSSRTCGDPKESVGRENLEDYNADFLVMLEI